MEDLYKKNKDLKALITKSTEKVINNSTCAAIPKSFKNDTAKVSCG